MTLPLSGGAAGTVLRHHLCGQHGSLPLPPLREPTHIHHLTARRRPPGHLVTHTLLC